MMGVFSQATFWVTRYEIAGFAVIILHMKTFLVGLGVGCVLGALFGYLFAAMTENLPHYRSQAAFMDGLYRPIVAFYGALAGAFLGLLAAVLLTVARRR